ncbi:lysylphosphatidylglycerol synthase transmembrane domain-containing protein [Desulfopila inferna]|uniref:lysylphosphatidylglycerol synthase transmembrane domain-containing protein n=1 Tax=Desulfopila inferna TaxID=468528 RepID=UPI001964C0DC|nr:lysylphosphatidylglycerol synthase transmembrane domain-containing protein [Desulfopila inferna]MBM9602702.1 flippase-like domain-containing protein [Desulfopila inferna]
MSLPKQNGKIRYCFLTILGLIAFGGLLYFGGFESFEKIKHPNYIWLLAAFCGSGFMIFIFAIRWGGIVNSLLGRKITDNMTYFFYSLSSLAVGTVLPHTAGSLVGKAAALNKFQKISMKNSAASVLLDKVFDGFFMLMFGWPLLLLLSGVATIKQVIVISIAEFLIISLLVLVHYSLWLRLLKITIASLVNFLGMFSFIRKRKQWQKIDALNRLDEWDVLQKETILRAYFLTAIGQLMLTVRAWLAAMAVGVGITPFEIFVGIGLVQASILISVTPGALGFADAAWFIALVGAGVPKEIIPVFLVSIRVIENLAVLFFWLPLYFFIIWKSAVRRRNK